MYPALITLCPARARTAALSCANPVPEQRMEYHDKVLKCAECGAEFVFTAGRADVFRRKGFKNEPKRCKACKANPRAGQRVRFGRRSAGRNEDGMLAVRERDDRSFQADSGAAGLLPRVFSAAAVAGGFGRDSCSDGTTADSCGLLDGERIAQPALRVFRCREGYRCVSGSSPWAMVDVRGNLLKCSRRHPNSYYQTFPPIDRSGPDTLR